MAVTEVKLHSQGTSGSASGSDNGTVKASFRSMYRVTCGSSLDTVDEVLHKFRTTASLPWMGRRFRFGNGFNTSVFCKTVDANYIENSAGKFNVTCSFESLDSDQQDQGQDSNGQATGDPFRWRDEVEVSYQNVMIPVENARLWGYAPTGIAGKAFLKPGYVGPILNSAGDPADPTLEKEMRIKVLRITKYLREYDDSFFESYQDAVNNDVFTINKPQYNFRMRVGLYRARFGSRSATFGMEGSIKYWRVTGELLITSLPYGWFQLVPDRGFHRLIVPERADRNGVTISHGDPTFTRRQFKEPIVDREGIPVSAPVLLDGTGEVHDQKNGNPPVYFIWQTFELKPFAGITW